MEECHIIWSQLLQDLYYELLPWLRRRSLETLEFLGEGVLGSNDEGLLMNVVGGRMTRRWLVPIRATKKKVSGQGMRIWDGVTHLAAVRESWGCLEVEKTPHCVGFSNLMVECFSVGHPRNVWIMPSRRAQYRLRLFAPPCILSEPI
jgi:hypothetical protein